MQENNNKIVDNKTLHSNLKLHGAIQIASSQIIRKKCHKSFKKFLIKNPHQLIAAQPPLMKAMSCFISIKRTEKNKNSVESPYSAE